MRSKNVRLIMQGSVGIGKGFDQSDTVFFFFFLKVTVSGKGLDCVGLRRKVGRSVKRLKQLPR